MMFNAAIILAVVSVPWTVVHFLLAVFRAGRWWDIIPLVGMLILAYALMWVVRKIWTLREHLAAFQNAIDNIATVFKIARYHPQGQKFIDRMTQPPTVFEREFRASMNRGDQW
jgi:ABC-type microcin C transport system permease subunit YejB